MESVPVTVKKSFPYLHAYEVSSRSVFYAEKSFQYLSTALRDAAPAVEAARLHHVVRLSRRWRAERVRTATIPKGNFAMGSWQSSAR